MAPLTNVVSNRASTSTPSKTAPMARSRCWTARTHMLATRQQQPHRADQPAFHRGVEEQRVGVGDDRPLHGSARIGRLGRAHEAVRSPTPPRALRDPVERLLPDREPRDPHVGESALGWTGTYGSASEPAISWNSANAVVAPVARTYDRARARRTRSAAARPRTGTPRGRAANRRPRPGRQRRGRRSRRRRPRSSRTARRARSACRRSPPRPNAPIRRCRVGPSRRHGAPPTTT